MVGEDERYAGIFGEREFVGAIFPGYLKELKHAAFVPAVARRGAREARELPPRARRRAHEHRARRRGARLLRLAVAEIFLHHRVLVVPIVDEGRVLGLITRHGFFRAVAERFQSGA